jgi:hypothetical protein
MDPAGRLIIGKENKSRYLPIYTVLFQASTAPHTVQAWVSSTMIHIAGVPRLLTCTLIPICKDGVTSPVTALVFLFFSIYPCQHNFHFFLKHLNRRLVGCLHNNKQASHYLGIVSFLYHFTSNFDEGTLLMHTSHSMCDTCVLLEDH